MSLTALESGTTVLFHAEELRNSGSIKNAGAQTLASEPVATTETDARFGTRSLDIYTVNYGGLRFPGVFTLMDLMAATMEGWFYIRSFRSSDRTLLGGGGSSGESFNLRHGSTGVPYLIYRDGNNNANVIAGSSPLPLNQWVHVAASVDAGRMRRLFVNGVQSASGSSVSTNFSNQTSAPFTIGGFGHSGGMSADALVDEVRCVLGFCLYTGDFAPETAAYPDPLEANQAASFGVLRRRSVHSPNPPAGVQSTHELTCVRDMNHGGRGQIIATVKEKNTPVNTPLRRKVWLVRERDAQIVRETWSDAVTGNYVFTGIDETQRYSVVSYDYLHNYRAVIADNLTPELMP